MEINNVEISSTLVNLKGNNLKDSLSVKYLVHETDDIESPNLEDVTSIERACLLSTDGHLDSCELDIVVSSNHKFGHLTLISECKKVEIFIGNLKEYASTILGELVDDFEGIKVHRFDISIKQYNVSKTTIKLIPRSNQFWIYGINVILLPSPNISSRSINLENVQGILANSNQKLSPNAEKCKAFLQSYMSGMNSIQSSSSSNISMQNPNMETLMSFVNANLEAKDVKNVTTEQENENSIVQLKQSFENQLSDLESRMDKKFTEQDEKLDKILKLLEKNAI